MRCLLKAADENKSKDDNQNELLSILIRNLTQIFNWCRVVSKVAFYRVQKNGLEPFPANDLRNTADLLLSLELAGPEVRALFPDDVLSIAFTAWWYENLASEDWPYSLNASAFIASYLDGNRKHDPSAQLRTIIDMELTAISIAGTALKKIQIALEQIRSAAGVPAFKALEDNALIASCLHQCINFGDKSSLSQRLIRIGIRTEFRKLGAGQLFAEVIEELLEAIYSKLGEPFIIRESIYLAVWSCCSFLLDCCDFQGSWPILAQSLKADLLSLVIFHIPLSIPPERLAEFEFARKVKILLTEIIPPFLVSFDVLDPVSKSICELSQSNIHVEDEDGFKSEWDLFEKLVFELTVCHRLYELKYKNKYSHKDTKACQYVSLFIYNSERLLSPKNSARL